MFSLQFEEVTSKSFGTGQLSCTYCIYRFFCEECTNPVCVVCKGNKTQLIDFHKGKKNSFRLARI